LGTTGEWRMLNCREVTELCSEEMELSLRLREQMLLGAYLLMCSGCTNYRKQMKILRQVMQAYSAGQAVTSEHGHGGPTSSDGSA
jgi:hypothetical protein